MGSSKVIAPPGPPKYRDDPDHAETASMASAVLLDDVEAVLDEDLPPYQDVPSPSSGTSAARPAGNGMHYEAPPMLPFSTSDLGHTEHRTRFPNFSTDSGQLYQMVKQQLTYPATYMVEIQGKHTETRRDGNKETKSEVVDFLIRTNLTPLLGPPGSGEIELLPDNKRGYRGTILPVLKPNVSLGADEESAPDELRRWCDKYVADPSKVKSFIIKREIINHDTKRLEQLLRSAIAETNYRGHVSISFPKKHQQVIVYSPGRINEWRITVWIRWLFYLTFLWVFAWPFLFFATSRYSVVKGVFKYADTPGGNDTTRRCTVMSEVEWFQRWSSAIKRAAIARMMCKDAFLDEEYRVATLEADQRGTRPVEPPRTGSAFADSALGLIGHGLRVAEDWNNSRGWGGDC